MTYHGNISLDWLLEAVSQRTLKGTSVPQQHEARQYLRQGFKYWPICDNTDAEGRCLGHEEES